MIWKNMKVSGRQGSRSAPWGHIPPRRSDTGNPSHTVLPSDGGSPVTKSRKMWGQEQWGTDRGCSGSMAMVLLLGVGMAGGDKLLDVLLHRRPPCAMIVPCQGGQMRGVTPLEDLQVKIGWNKETVGQALGAGNSE